MQCQIGNFVDFIICQDFVLKQLCIFIMFSTKEHDRAQMSLNFYTKTRIISFHIGCHFKARGPLFFNQGKIIQNGVAIDNLNRLEQTKQGVAWKMDLEILE